MGPIRFFLMPAGALSTAGLVDFRGARTSVGSWRLAQRPIDSSKMVIGVKRNPMHETVATDELHCVQGETLAVTTVTPFVVNPSCTWPVFAGFPQ